MKSIFIHEQTGLLFLGQLQNAGDDHFGLLQVAQPWQDEENALAWFFVVAAIVVFEVLHV